MPLPAHALEPPDGVRLAERFYRLADRLPPGPRRYARGVEHPLDLAALLPALRRHRPDVVHVQWLPMHAVDRSFWRAASRLLGVPIVFTAHDSLPNVGRRHAPRAPQRAQRPRLRARDHAHAPRRATCSPSASASRPTASRASPWAPSRSYRDVEPVPPPVPDGAPVAALVGLLRPYKGLDLLLDAWPAVRERVPDAVLLIAGRPFGEPAAERAAALAADPASGVVAELRYVSRAEFAGALRRAACCVLPYRRIDQSAVLLSTLAVGCPVVAPTSAGCGEVVEESGAGLVVPAGDAAALADAIARILGDPALQERLAAAALDAVDRIYSWDVAAERHEAVYRAGGRRARRRRAVAFPPCPRPPPCSRPPAATSRRRRARRRGLGRGRGLPARRRARRRAGGPARPLRAARRSAARG